MPTFLTGFNFHEPESYALYRRGIVEDFESSTRLFVDAENEAAALQWAEMVAAELLKAMNSDENLDWKGLGYFAWIETEPTKSAWAHCLTFFQRVNVGEMPDLRRLGTQAYARWAEANGVKY